jgi:hypothetical protein
MFAIAPVVRSYQTKYFFASRDFRVASADQHSKISVTLPRSPRIKWGADTPDAPLQVPSGTESMRMNAALARVYVSSSRRLATRSHEEKWC